MGGQIVNLNNSCAKYYEVVTPENSAFKFLSYGRFFISSANSLKNLSLRNEEALLFCVSGKAKIVSNGKEFILNEYDSLYLPKDTCYNILNMTNDVLDIITVRAPSDIHTEIVHTKFEDLKKDISGKKYRKLKGGREIFILLDTNVKASKLVAGLAIFAPFAHTWPLHKHDDQEEIYIFLHGRGAVELFLTEESKCFVREVKEGDALVIPFGYIHPVFNFDNEMHFLWVVAGERYFIGDKINLGEIRS